MKRFREQMQEQLQKMAQQTILFRSNIKGSTLWEVYINSFEADPIYRDPESSLHNCNHCNNFIRRYGNIIAINLEDYSIMTLFDFIPEEEEFIPVVEGLQSELRQGKIENVFIETFDSLKSLPYESCKKTQETFRLGVIDNVKRYNKEEAELYPEAGIKEGDIKKFEHMALDMPKQFIDFSGKSIESIEGEHRDNFQVFARAMNEIPLDTYELVRDLINQGSLLDAISRIPIIEQMIALKKHYNDVPSKHREKWLWVTSHKLAIAKFRNTLIGVLCVELAEGMELNKACINWNKRVDPINFMKAKAPITKRQIKEAEIFVEENGYTESFCRRPATIDDIKAEEIFHLNSEGGEQKTEAKLFDGVKPTKSTQHKRSEFDGVEEIGIEKFMKDILPTCTSVEAFLNKNHENNMVTLTTSVSDGSKNIFKWNNNYSWTYNGNLAGKSMIKEAVIKAGGKVDGVLNFRLAWNQSGEDSSDLDAWACDPDNVRIGYCTPFRKHGGSNKKSNCSGQLDVDILNPHGKLAVENITWHDINSMKNGVYKVWVNPYSVRNSQGFQAEIEFDGQTYSYEYNKRLKSNVKVAEITFKNGEFSIKHLLPCVEESSQEIYGLESNKFHKVNLVCLSPNYWGENKVGNKHYFFMLEKAQANKKIRSFHNENLKSDLVKHRKVMEVLANTTMVESGPTELSGLGFNATVRDELILRLKGSHKRIVKVKF